MKDATGPTRRRAAAGGCNKSMDRKRIALRETALDDLRVFPLTARREARFQFGRV